uniref:Uncharacterized protein n=1 Tax=Plectus sambesii TaxID=2011161 RepID=A0A914VP54_9BILA
MGARRTADGRSAFKRRRLRLVPTVEDAAAATADRPSAPSSRSVQIWSERRHDAVEDGRNTPPPTTAQARPLRRRCEQAGRGRHNPIIIGRRRRRKQVGVGSLCGGVGNRATETTTTTTTPHLWWRGAIAGGVRDRASLAVLGPAELRTRQVHQHADK